MTDGQEFKVDMFAQRLGESFHIQLEPSQRTLTLVEVTPHPSRSAPRQDATQREAFSLLFHDQEAVDDSYLPQGIYPLEHEELGRLDIFIVPIGPDAEKAGMRYEAVFS